MAACFVCHSDIKGRNLTYKNKFVFQGLGVQHLYVNNIELSPK